MAEVGRSPRSTLRRSIPEAYRARGHHLNDLWLVYSPKTDRDWLLPSDRQLVHWLIFLESDREVLSFDLAPEPIMSCDANEHRATEIDAIALYRDRHLEWHEVKAGTALQGTDRSQFQAQVSAAQKAGATYRIINDKELGPNARLAIRWLKAIGYAAVIRGQEHGPCRSALVAYLNEKKNGYVRSIIYELQAFDTAVVLGLLVRLTLSGIVCLDLEDRSFGLGTNWRLYGE